MGNEQLDVKVNFNVSGVSEIGKAAKELKGLGKAGSDAEPGLKKATESTFGMNDAIKKLAAGGVLLAAGKALVNFGKQSINTASDIEEMQSKFNTVFKDLSGSVTADLQTFADAANRSVYDLQGFAATLQDTFVPLGFAREEAADMSVQLVKLAEDLASFNNLNTADVVADLQSALVGNTETLRKYGVVANQAAIDQKALELGLEFTKGKMDAQTKSAAILALTLESTTDAQGDAIKTSDSYANQVKGLDAAMTDLQAVVGEALLPAMTDLVEIATQATKQLSIAAGALGGYSKEVENIVSSNIEASQSMEELVEQGQRIQATYEDAGTAGRLVTGTNKAFADSSIDTAIAIAKAAGSFEEYESAIHGAFGGQVEFANILNRSSEYAGKTAYEVYELAKSQQELDTQTQAAGAATERWAAMAGQAEEAISGVSTETMNASEWADAYTKHLEASSHSIELQKEVAAEAARAQEKHAEAMAEAAEASKKLEQAQASTFAAAVKSTESIGFFNESAAEMADRTVYLSGLTRDQSDILSDLQSEYDKAAQTVRDYTVGVDSVGISQEEQAKKVEEATARMNELQEAMNPLLSVQGEYANVTGQSTINQDAVNQALFDAAQAAGASASELAILGGALGLYSDEAVEAALQTAIIQTKINELAAAYADGSIGVDAMRAELTGFIAELNNAPDTAAVVPDVTTAVEGLGSVREQALLAAEGYGETADGTVTLDEASAALNETLGETITSTADLQGGYAGITEEMILLQKEAYGVNEAMGALPKQVDISVNYHTSGSPPTAGGGGGSAGPGFAEGTGGQFMTVPAGFPNDSYNIGLTSGERFMVIPAGGGGNTTNTTTNSLTANINVGSPAEYVDPLKQALRETGIRGF